MSVCMSVFAGSCVYLEREWRKSGEKNKVKGQKKVKPKAHPNSAAIPNSVIVGSLSFQYYSNCVEFVCRISVEIRQFEPFVPDSPPPPAPKLPLPPPTLPATPNRGRAASPSPPPTATDPAHLLSASVTIVSPYTLHSISIHSP